MTEEEKELETKLWEIRNLISQLPDEGIVAIRDYAESLIEY